MASSISRKGKNFIKGWEGNGLSGYSFQPYYDAAGYPTVGYGKLLRGSRSSSKNRVIPRSEAKKILNNNGISYNDDGRIITISASTANSLFENSISSTVRSVRAHRNSSKLTQSQFDALVSICYNCGVSSVLNSSDMKYLLNNNQTYRGFIGPITYNFEQRVTYAFEWTRAGGSKLSGLVRRRNEELEMFCENMRYSFKRIR